MRRKMPAGSPCGIAFLSVIPERSAFPLRPRLAPAPDTLTCMASLATPAALNESFALPGILTFDEHNGLPRALVHAAYLHRDRLSARRAPYPMAADRSAGTSSSFRPGPRLPPTRPFAAASPSVFPWFGNGLTGSQKPSHGFARLEEWTFAFAALVSGQNARPAAPPHLYPRSPPTGAEPSATPAFAPSTNSSSEGMAKGAGAAPSRFVSPWANPGDEPFPV